jgi:hypothetical protein
VHQTHRKQSHAGPLVVQRIHQRLLPGATEPTADGVASRPHHPKSCKATPADIGCQTGAILFSTSRKTPLLTVRSSVAAPSVAPTPTNQFRSAVSLSGHDRHHRVLCVRCLQRGSVPVIRAARSHNTFRSTRNLQMERATGRSPKQSPDQVAPMALASPPAVTCAPSAHPSESLPLALVVRSPILERHAGPGASIAETLRPA